MHPPNNRLKICEAKVTKLKRKLEMPDVGDRRMEEANHIAMYVCMQQSYMICTCTPEPKVQFKKGN